MRMGWNEGTGEREDSLRVTAPCQGKDERCMQDICGGTFSSGLECDERTGCLRPGCRLGPMRLSTADQSILVLSRMDHVYINNQPRLLLYSITESGYIPCSSLATLALEVRSEVCLGSEQGRFPTRLQSPCPSHLGWVDSRSCRIPASFCNARIAPCFRLSYKGCPVDRRVLGWDLGSSVQRFCFLRPWDLFYLLFFA